MNLERTNTKVTSIVLVDDHILFRKGLIELINDFPDYRVIWEADNGQDFIRQFSMNEIPEIILLDINMPIMDGYETANWIHKNQPNIKILTLSMHNDEETVLKMLKSGIDGYILKNSDPDELRRALETINQGGTFYTNCVTEALLKSLYKNKKVDVALTSREVEFLKLACTELPYKSFSPLLNIHPRMVEATREILFRKLEVTTRVGLVIYAIKHGLFKLN
ncbi:response regulator transcription factor [Spirosoma sp. KCTC 42546]|uniref:response regulator transcription factor n=1 Tax=Spirosoma sp. KCTC 42546 TaxID=2520506 RepID=UPI00115AF081|nr:response regulator transcription factor [Spirosoma sp. KCTC 42546]QDK82626.1 response regulator transcription factor [Spirosoma sp. KCTC 42546]